MISFAEGSPPPGRWEEVNLANIRDDLLAFSGRTMLRDEEVKKELEGLECSKDGDFITAMYVNMDSEYDDVTQVQCEGGTIWLHTIGFPVHYCKAYEHNPLN